MRGGLLQAQPAWCRAASFRELESSLNVTRITLALEIADHILRLMIA
jgi:hypothetical protein